MLDTQAFTAASTNTCNDATTTPTMATTRPASCWTSWINNTIGKTSQRIDRKPAAISTTAYTYPANGPTAV